MSRRTKVRSEERKKNESHKRKQEAELERFSATWFGSCIVSANINTANDRVDQETHRQTSGIVS